MRFAVSLLPSSSLASTGRRIVSFANSFTRGSAKAAEKDAIPGAAPAIPSPPDPAQEATLVPTTQPTTPSEVRAAVRGNCIRRFGADRCRVDAGAPATTHEALGDFHWKPQSDLDGRLVVRFGPRFEHRIARVAVVPADGSEGWIGRTVGRDEVGRTHVRFDRPGAQLAAGSELEVELKDGRRLRRALADPGLEWTAG